MECKHFWVFRVDGVEEQCLANICLICGKYGCGHDFDRSIEDYDKPVKVRMKKLFMSLGVEGNEHEIEKKLKKVNKNAPE